MSSIIFYLDQDQAFVATDTLAVEPGGLPSQFCSKAIYLPHLRTIIAGTGMGMFSGDWAMYVNNRMVLSGIQNLDYHTPTLLRRRWVEYKHEFDLPEDMTTTIYQFGLSEDSNEMLGYAYRSTNDFVSEPRKYGYGIKPECTVPEDGSLVENLPGMMNEQRRIQASKPESERLYIGGHAIGMHLTRDGCNTFRVFEFNDYEDHLAQVISNHAKNAT